MKTNISLRLIRLMLFCTAAVLTLSTGTSAFAQGKHTKSRPLRLPPVFVEADMLTPPDTSSDDTISLPDGTVVAMPILNSDGSFTLPDGSVVALPARGDSDGTVILPDGTTATRNANGTLTLADGSVIEAAQVAPQPVRANSAS